MLSDIGHKLPHTIIQSLFEFGAAVMCIKPELQTAIVERELI